MTEQVNNKIRFDSDFLPERLYALREGKLGLSQKAFADLIGISQSVLSKWERGIHPPPPAALMRIGDVSKGDREWWYRKAGPEHGKRLQASDLASRIQGALSWNRDLLVEVIEIVSAEALKRGKNLTTHQFATIVALTYEHYQRTGTREIDVVDRFLLVA